MTISALDHPTLEVLARQAANGDRNAQGLLVQALWPVWRNLVLASRSMGSMAHSIEHVDNVVGKLVEKFGRAEGHAVRRYIEWRKVHGEQTFADWMRIVTKNEIRNYVRQQLGTGRIPTGELSVKRLLNELAVSPLGAERGIRPNFTAEQTARELLHFAASRLPSGQLRALQLWLSDSSFVDIGRELGCSEKEAQDRVRAAKETLRRHFAGKTVPGDRK